MSSYRVLQLTNDNIGAVVANALMPLGDITRRIQENSCGCATFNIASSADDTVYLNEIGNYNIVYSASLIASEAGEIAVTLIANGETIYEVGVTASAVGDVVNLTSPTQVRVCPNCSGIPNRCPLKVQLRLSGVAISGGRANLLIERVY